MKKIKNLLGDPQLRSKVSNARDAREATEILVTAGAKRDEVAALLSRLAGIRQLGEQELLGVAGGLPRDTHSHMSCCTECPPGAGLC